MQILTEGLRFCIMILKNGSRGDDVREIQEKLIALGYLDGKADGIFGPKTEGAVLAYQKDRNLDETGMVGTGISIALAQDAEEALEDAA